MTDRISESDLRAEVLRAGHRDESPSQLKRLRREGLLQRSEQRHELGVAGSKAWYPSEALPQLLGVTRIKETRRQRPFRAVRFLAWEEGLWVDHQLMRLTLAQWVRESAVITQRLTGRGDPQDRAAERALFLARSSTSRSSVAQTREKDRDPSDHAFAVMQLAEGFDDAPMSAELLDAATGFPEIAATHGQQTNIVEAYQRFDPPPVSQWPRRVSRASRMRLAVGQAYLSFFKHLTEAEVVPAEPQLWDDSDKGIRYRAPIAAIGVVLGPDLAKQIVKPTTGEEL